MTSLEKKKIVVLGCFKNLAKIILRLLSQSSLFSVRDPITNRIIGYVVSTYRDIIFFETQTAGDDSPFEEQKQESGDSNK